MDRTTPSSILIIGEDSNVCYLLRSYARRSSFQAVYSCQGAHAVEVAGRDRPSIILLDLDLPAHSGWSVLQALKHNPGTQHIPVVIYTWLDEHELCLQAGASHCLRMPILYADFLDALVQSGVR